MDSDANAARPAVVTGAASGIGLAVAHHLAEQGHPVTLLDQNGEAAETAAARLREAGAAALACEADVTDRTAIDKALTAARDRFGPVQIVITSAGIEAFDPLAEITPDKWERIIAINLTGTFNSIQPVVPDMLAARWGRIITISSVSAQTGAPNMAHYAASKGGVIALTKALSHDLAPQGITVNTIPPSIVDTPMAQKATEAGDFPGLETMAPLTPVRRVGTPDDIGATCAFLCTDKASFITGQTIGVNGGWYM
jgi:NAD(P)-dependent dehydrogenase (short-subunit alcohol dehydrogenase family)